MEKLQAIKSKIEEIQAKSVFATDLKSFATLFLKVLKESKDDFKSISNENKALIGQTLTYLEQEHDKLKDNVSSETDKAKKDFELAINEVKSLVKELKSIEIKDGNDGLDGYTPVKGEDYFTDKEIKDIKDSILEQIPEQQNIEEIVKGINDLPTDNSELKIDAKHIKNLPEQIVYRGGGVSGIKEIIAGSNITVDNSNLGYPVISSTGGGSSTFLDLTDTPSSYSGQTLKGVRVNAGETGLEFFTLSGDTDEKVKYDSSDPTAGYVADKIVAGTGISVAEGTGGNENKLVITSTITQATRDSLGLDTDDTVTFANLSGTNTGDQDLSGLVPYTGATSNVDLGTNDLITDTITSKSSGGLILENASGGDVLHIGSGGGVNATAYGGWNFDGATANTIAYFGASKTLSSLDTATYPSLTELSYVKGVTSSIQTQLNAKGVGSVTSVALTVPTGLTISGSPVTGSGTLAVGLDTGYEIPLSSTISGKADKSGALTQFVGNGNWKLFYSDGSGDIQELALGSSGTFLKSNGASSAPTFATAGGTGDVSKVGTPVNNQIGIWTGDGTIEGDVDLVYDSSVKRLTLGSNTGGAGDDAVFRMVDNDGTVRLLLDADNTTDSYWSGLLGIGLTSLSRSAYLELVGGSTTIAPLIIKSGTNLTTPVNGAIENSGTHLYYTAGGVRYQLDQQGGSISDGDKGDITVSSSGTVWTIDNGVVSLAKQADVATATVFYRKTAGTGSPEVQTLATLKTDLGLTGTNSGDVTVLDSTEIDFTLTGQQITASLIAGSIANSKLTNSAITIAGSSTSLGGSISQDTITGLSSTGIIKRTGANTLAIAVADTDYLTPATAASTYQPLDTTLTALAAYNTNGLLTQTAANTFTGRTLTGTANQITVTNGDGVAGNPTLSLPSDVIIPTVLTVPNTGLHILDTNASHDLIIAAGSNLTADRTLSIITGDTAMNLDLTAVTDEYVLAYDTTTNTWRGVASSGGGANTALSNLASVQINTNLVFVDDASPTEWKIKVDNQASSNTDGNPLTIEGGTGNGTGTGSNITIQAGAGGSSAGTGGQVLIQGGSGGIGSSTGGDINLFPGAGNSTNGVVAILDAATAARGIIDTSGLSTDRTFTLPDQSGTIALLATNANFNTLTVNTNLVPDANDGAGLGTSTLQFSDLYLAEGGVINWDNGDATLTQTGNVLALAGADLRVATADVGTNADSVPTISSTSTLTNKRITPRVTTETSSATPTINTDNSDAHSITALATAITSMTTNLSGTPTNFQKLIIRIKDNGTARAITWGASFEAKGVALPTTTVISKVLTVGFIYDTVTSKWGCVASAQEA